MPTAKVNGAEIYYEEAGSGPPIILSPGGLNFSLEPYRAVLQGLSQKHRAIGYDRRFGGRSKSPLVVQTWDLCSNDVIGLMDSLGIEQAYLGGSLLWPRHLDELRRPSSTSGPRVDPIQHGRWHHPQFVPGGEAVQEWSHGRRPGHENSHRGRF